MTAPGAVPTDAAYPDPSSARIDELRPGACAVVLDDRGRVLLQKRADNGHWGLPGGSMEKGESAAACCVREAREETGLEVEVVRLLGVYSDPARRQLVRYPDGRVVHYLTVALVCRVVGGEARVNDESTEQGWFALDALPEPLVPAHRMRLADLDAPAPPVR
jgi:ADP-ribose pyrophosphatase YjhB (NUDIX family)